MTESHGTMEDIARLRKQREDLQFQKMYQAIDQGKSPRPSILIANGGKTKKSLNLNTIQLLLEKDMVKKMPIKLKAQLRQTQDITDAIVGGTNTDMNNDLDNRQSIRILNVLPQRKIKKPTLTQISSGLIKEQVRKNLERSSSSSSDSSCSMNSSQNNKTNNATSNKKKVLTGIANTRNLIAKLVKKKEKEQKLQKIYQDYSEGNIDQYKQKEKDAEDQLNNNLGVDQQKFEHRISLIQAKNKQIDSRVNLELGRKFKKSLAGTNLKNQIQQLVEQVALEGPRESLIKNQLPSPSKQLQNQNSIELPTIIVPPSPIKQEDSGKPVVVQVPTASKLKKLMQSKSANQLHPEKQQDTVIEEIKEVQEDEENRQIREDAQKFVQMARYSLLPHVNRKEVYEIPQLILDADNLFKKKKSSKGDSKSDRSSDTTSHYQKSQTQISRLPNLSGAIILEESINESSIQQTRQQMMTGRGSLIQSKSQNQLQSKKTMTKVMSNNNGMSSTKTQITEIIKTCSNELPPYFLNTLTPINQPKKHLHMFERKVNPKLDDILNRNKNKYMISCEKELEELSVLGDSTLRTIKEAQKDIHFELFANSNDYSRLFTENTVVSVHPLATEENKDFLEITQSKKETSKKEKYRRLRLRMFDQMENSEQDKIALNTFLMSQTQYQQHSSNINDANYFSFGLQQPQPGNNP